MKVTEAVRFNCSPTSHREHVAVFTMSFHRTELPITTVDQHEDINGAVIFVTDDQIKVPRSRQPYRGINAPTLVKHG